MISWESVKNISIKIFCGKVLSTPMYIHIYIYARREVGERARSELDDVRERESIAKTSVLQNASTDLGGPRPRLQLGNAIIRTCIQYVHTYPVRARVRHVNRDVRGKIRI